MPAWTSLDRLELQFGFDACLGLRADQLLHHAPVLEQDHRGDREDLVLDGGLLVLVHVELDYPQVLALVANLLEDRRDHAARPAPRRPEVDEYCGVCLKDLDVEGCVGHIADLPGHGSPLRSVWCCSSLPPRV